MDHQTNKRPRLRKIGAKSLLVYGGLLLCLCGAFFAASRAASFRLQPKPAEPTPLTTAAPLTTEKPTQPTTRRRIPETTENRAVLAQEDGITRADHFSMPLEGETDKGFSGGDMVQSKTMGDWRVHNGVDFRGAVGDRVRAVNNGIVKSVYDDVLWGTVVEIDHGDGLLARYCGLGKGSTPAVGERVKINDRIGNLGEVPVESADAPHLHFELRQDNRCIDPMPVLQS